MRLTIHTSHLAGIALDPSAADPASDHIIIRADGVTLDLGPHFDNQPKTEVTHTGPTAPVGMGDKTVAYITEAERTILDAIRDGLGRFHWNHVPNRAARLKAIEGTGFDPVNGGFAELIVGGVRFTADQVRAALGCE